MFTNRTLRSGWTWTSSEHKRVTTLHCHWDALAKESNWAIRRPILLLGSRFCLPQPPDVSMTKGTNSTPVMMSKYLAFLLGSDTDGTVSLCMARLPEPWRLDRHIGCTTGAPRRSQSNSNTDLRIVQFQSCAGYIEPVNRPRRACSKKTSSDD